MSMKNINKLVGFVKKEHKTEMTTSECGAFSRSKEAKKILSEVE